MILYTLLIILSVLFIIQAIQDLIYRLRRNETLSNKIVDKLIEKAIKHEEPIMLNVNVNRLIKRVADEIETRNKQSEKD